MQIQLFTKPLFKTKYLILIGLITINFFSCDEDEITSIPKIPILEIGQVFPETNDLGDTISLKGKNFKRNMKLSINEKLLDIVFNNDSLIKFRIPYHGFDPTNFKIKVNIEDTITKLLPNPFRLYKPIIDSISEPYGFEDYVTVYGKHLTNDPNSTNDIVYLNQKAINVTNHNRDSIVFLLPSSINTFEIDILIKAQLQLIERKKGVKIPKPIIGSISKDSVLVGDKVTIYGSHLYSRFSNAYEISIANNKVEILNIYRDSITVKIPLGPYNDREIGNIKIKLFDSEANKNTKLYLKNKWYLNTSKRHYEVSNGIAAVGNITPWSFHDNNAMYFNIFRKENNKVLNNYLYKYNPNSREWLELIKIPIETESMRFGDVFHLYPLNDGEHVYIYLNRKSNNFYKFNFITGEITPLADFIFDDIISRPTGFFDNNLFYFGLGTTGSNSVFQNRKLWKYDESINKWGLVSEIPLVSEKGLRNFPSIFKQNGKIYIGNGDEKTYDFWEFTPGNNWIRKSDITNPVQNAIHTQIEEKGFYYNRFQKNIWEYDINNDKWKKRDELKINTYSFGHETMFIHDNYVYIVGYQLGYPPNVSNFSNYDHIILRTEISNFK